MNLRVALVFSSVSCPQTLTSEADVAKRASLSSKEGKGPLVPAQPLHLAPVPLNSFREPPAWDLLLLRLPFNTAYELLNSSSLKCPLEGPCKG